MTREDALREGLRLSAAWVSILVWSWAPAVRAQTAPTPGTCEPGAAEAWLDHNNVRARILNNGGLFYDGEPHFYEVPAYGGVHALFGASLWIAGFVGDDLRISASRYSDREMWPGPLSDGAVLPSPDDCTPYDRIYEITWDDLQDYETTGRASANLRDWPWQLGAPVIDGDGTPDNYDLAAGDRPELIGHQRLWWVMNDVGSPHETTGSAPLGVEVQASAIAASSVNPSIDNATVYRYRIINRSAFPIDSAFVALFTDPDLGNFGDDFAGMDTTLGMAFTYNSDNEDETAFGGYGSGPPAVGLMLLDAWPAESDGIDNDFDGLVDELGEKAGIGHFTVGLNLECEFCSPPTARIMYLAMNAQWRDGTPVTEGGSGRYFSETPTRYFYPGDPTTAAYWSERNNDGTGNQNAPGDRIWIPSIGPINLRPGGEITLTFAYVWARGTDYLDSITELRRAATDFRKAWKAGFELPAPIAPDGSSVPIAPVDGSVGLPPHPRLWWSQVSSSPLTRLQVGRDRDFDLVVADTVVHGTDAWIHAADPGRYWWRIAPTAPAASGAWSDAWSFDVEGPASGSRGVFTDFEVTANASGPLDPPDCGAFAFNASGYPLDSCGSDRPNVDRQQTSGAAWGVSTVGDGARRYGSIANPESFLGRVTRGGATINDLLPFDYEIRFTAQGSRAWRTQDGGPIDAPFEVWRTGVRTPDDPSDDVRLLVAVTDLNTAGIFDLGGDHPISGDNNDPFTDALSVYLPNDLTPGTSGYEVWAAGQDPADHGPLVLADLVLVNWNGGEEPPYAADLPEPGTVFRLELADRYLDPPVPVAPASGAALAGPGVEFFWQIRGDDLYRLQVAGEVSFQRTVIDTTTPDQRVRASMPTEGIWYWRVSGLTGQWSPTFAFSTDTGTTGTEGSGLPIEFALHPVYPNPFSGTARVGIDLPDSAPVTARLYDVTGRLVARVAESRMMPGGTHELTLDGTGLGSGVYLLEVRAGARRETRTVVLVR